MLLPELLYQPLVHAPSGRNGVVEILLVMFQVNLVPVNSSQASTWMRPPPPSLSPWFVKNPCVLKRCLKEKDVNNNIEENKYVLEIS